LAAADVNSFKDWTVVCDNLRTCQVAGFAPEDSESSAMLRLSRAGQAGAPAQVEIDLSGDGGPKGKAPTLVVDGRVVMTAPAASASGDGGFVLTLDDAQVGPLLGAARKGTVLSIRAGDKDLGQVSLAGMVAALRYVDEQQKRAGTVTAMVAKGPAPAASVPAPPPLPVLHVAPAIAQTGLPSKSPPAVAALAGKTECDVEPDRGEPPQVSRLSADKVLWQVPCWTGAYNFSSLFVIVDKAGRASPAPFGRRRRRGGGQCRLRPQDPHPVGLRQGARGRRLRELERVGVDRRGLRPVPGDGHAGLSRLWPRLADRVPGQGAIGGI
jgi:hypothetical protein